MRVLFVGGPLAGKFMELPDPAPPMFHVPVRNRTDWAEEAMCHALDVTPASLGPTTATYRRGTRPHFIAGITVIGYLFCGDDKYGGARTREMVVAFDPPTCLADVHGKTEVEWLIYDALKGRRGG